MAAEPRSPPRSGERPQPHPRRTPGASPATPPAAAPPGTVLQVESELRLALKTDLGEHVCHVTVTGVETSLLPPCLQFCGYDKGVVVADRAGFPISSGYPAPSSICWLQCAEPDRARHLQGFREYLKQRKKAAVVPLVDGGRLFLMPALPGDTYVEDLEVEGSMRCLLYFPKSHLAHEAELRDDLLAVGWGGQSEQRVEFARCWLAAHETSGNGSVAVVGAEQELMNLAREIIPGLPAARARCKDAASDAGVFPLALDNLDPNRFASAAAVAAADPVDALAAGMAGLGVGPPSSSAAALRGLLRQAGGSGSAAGASIVKVHVPGCHCHKHGETVVRGGGGAPELVLMPRRQFDRQPYRGGEIGWHLRELLDPALLPPGQWRPLLRQEETHVLALRLDYPERFEITLPGGKRELGESVEECARREFSEESGLALERIGQLEEVCSVRPLDTSGQPGGKRILLLRLKQQAMAHGSCDSCPGAELKELV